MSLPKKKNKKKTSEVTDALINKMGGNPFTMYIYIKSP